MPRARAAIAVSLVFALGCTKGKEHTAAAPKPIDREVAEEQSDFSLTAFDVGTGLAVLVRGKDFTLLYDGGSNDDRKSGASNRLVAYLRLALGPSPVPDCGGEPETTTPELPTLDHVLVSHPHRDHLSLLPDVFRCFQVDNVWESGMPSETEAYRKLEGAIEAEPEIEKHRGGEDFDPGDVFELGRSARMKILSVRPGASDPNDASIVVSLELGRSRVLLMGDATGGERARPDENPARGSVEAALLDHPGDLRADVLVVGHHGSMTSTRAAFLEAVRPSIAIVSSGPMPYGKVVLPDEAIVSLLATHGAQVLRTDVDDASCATNAAKVGADADGAPGGCNAVSVLFERGEAPHAATLFTHD